MAFQQISQSGHRRRGTSDFASERLQYFQSNRSCPHHAGRIGPVASRLRVDALFCQRSRTMTHEAMASTLDLAMEQINNPKRCPHERQFHSSTLADGRSQFAQGLDRSEVVDGLQIEGTFRAHQVPLSDPATHPEHLRCWKTG